MGALRPGHPNDERCGSLLPVGNKGRPNPEEPLTICVSTRTTDNIWEGATLTWRSLDLTINQLLLHQTTPARCPQVLGHVTDQEPEMALHFPDVVGPVLVFNKREPGRHRGKGAGVVNDRIQFGFGRAEEVQGALGQVVLDTPAPDTVHSSELARVCKATPTFGVHYVAIAPPMSVSLNVSDRLV
jgi:hypothetical protein